MTEAGTDVVCDTGPIIHPDEIGFLDLVKPSLLKESALRIKKDLNI